MAQRRQAIKLLPRVFVDSSVFFTAVNSPVGGSAKLFSLGGKKFHLLTSVVVLAETERNVRKKLLSFHLKRFFMLVKHTNILQQLPNQTLLTKAERIITAKDAVILAEAKQARAEYLVTLDKKHFFTKKVEQFLKPTKISTPKDLLTKS